MTAGTIEDSLTEWHLLAMSTPAACLTRIGRIDSNVLSPSFFRFGVQLTEEGRPRGICNAFGKTMIVGHAVDAEVFHADHSEAINNLTALLVGEVLPPPGNAFMDTGDRNAYACMLGGPDGGTLFIAAAEWHGMTSMFDTPGTGRVLSVRAPAPCKGEP